MNKKRSDEKPPADSMLPAPAQGRGQGGPGSSGGAKPAGEYAPDREKDGIPEERYAALLSSCRIMEEELSLKNAELARLHQEYEVLRDRYFWLFDLAPVGYLILDKYNLIGEINLTCADLWGYSRSELLKKAVQRFIPDADRTALHQFLFTLKLSSAIRSVELRIQRKDGHLVPVQMSAVPMTGEGSAEAGQIFMSLTDVTTQKQAEEVLKRDKDFFEQRVKERTDELVASREELHKARRLAEIGSLAAIVAHELRSPLAAIMATIYNISRKESREEVKEKLAKIEKKVLESNHIIDNLLSYSRVRLPYFETVSPKELLEEVLENMQANYKALGVMVRADLQAIQGLVIKADHYQLNEVFTNILNNAYQSFERDAAGKFIDIGAAREAGQLLIRIKDTGRGIPAEDLPRIFEPFFTRKAKGTGLGLSISKEIITMHGGSLAVQSNAGEGTTVTISFPLPS